MPTQPTLFVGLGGSGVRTLSHLKRLLARSISKKELADNYRFLLFDTDETEWQVLKAEFASEFSVDPNFIDRDREWHSLGNFNPQARWREVQADPTNPRHRDILEWIDSSMAGGFPNQIVTIGAEARRQLGRFCLAHHYNDFRTTLDEALKSLNDPRQGVKNQAKTQIVVVSSSCGGTGSSIFFDTIYLLALLYHGIARSEPFLRPVIYAPKPYIDVNKAKNVQPELIARYHANACAFFMELQMAFAKHEAGRRSTAKDFILPSADEAQAFDVNWLPFQGALVIDSQREGDVTFLQFDQLYAATAEMLFYLALSGTDTTVASWWTNCDASVKSTSHHTFPRYATAGFRAVEYPTTALKNYLIDRFTFDLLECRFVKGTPIAERTLQDRARELVLNEIMRPLVGTEEDRESGFLAFERRQHLEQPGNIIERARSIDEFCEFDATNPDKAPQVSLSAITADRLDGATNDLRREVGNLKSLIRKDFVNRFGRPSGLDSSYYGQTLDRLYGELEGLVESNGISAWAGVRENPGTGLVNHLLEQVAERNNAAKAALQKSNQIVDKGYGDDGLAKLRDEILQLTAGAGKLFGRDKRINQLREKLTEFAAKRAELVEEAFGNLMLMLEIELLTYVGWEGPEVQFLEYFTSQIPKVQSLLSRLKGQGSRIRDWLDLAVGEAETRLEATAVSIDRQSLSLLTKYEPALSEVSDRQGNPGALSRAALQNLTNETRQTPSIMAKLSAAGGRSGCDWRSICAQEGEQSHALRDALFSGCNKWVESQFNTDVLRRTVNCTLEEYLSSDRCPDGTVSALRELLNVEHVAAFSPISHSSRAERFRAILFVTALPPGKGSIAQKLGYQEGSSKYTHVLDPVSPQRVLVEKVYAGLYLEDDFTWWSEFRNYYDRLADYEPHLWADGRIRVIGAGSEIRWKLAFATALFWAFHLSSGKWLKSDAHLRGLFTEKLEDDPEGYLHESPLALRNKVPHFLSIDLDDTMVDSNGRLECSLPRAAFLPVGKARQYSAAWAAFQKRPKTLANIEFFQKWCAGVECEWIEGSEFPHLTPRDEDRARYFLEKLTAFRDTVRGAREEMETIKNRSNEDSGNIRVLGWVASTIRDHITDLKKALDEPTL